MVRGVLLLLLLPLAACNGEAGTPDAGPGFTPWTPGFVEPSPGATAPRGLVDLRGIIHAHSVHSHDACDGAPKDEATGAIDEVCFDDFRRGLCQVQHDFVMLTDHRGTFTDTEFPETLLFRDARGDVLVDRGAGPVASWAGCASGHKTLILAGSESGTMPVGLEGHASADRAERGRLYGSVEPVDMEALKAAGAVVLQAHTEGRTDEELATKPYDGFEMYNVHANLFLKIGEALGLLEQIANDPDALPHPDLVLMPLVSEDPNYVDRWGRVLNRGVKRVTTMGTDCHRNTIPDLLPDGERVDSYRRMMLWYSNHLLVTPEADGTWDDRRLKAALRAGRLYGVFELMGYAEGFDYRTLEGAEMGDEASISAGATLSVTRPDIVHLDPAGPAPEMTLRILRAVSTGWEEVASGPDDLTHTPTVPGAYRAEVRMVPHHLRAHLSSYDFLVDEESFVWIYANPIYMVP